MTQSALKLLAMLCMLCDHLAKVVLSTGALCPVLGMAGNRQLMIGLEVIGRIAFPIFAWFVAEGCRKTGNRAKYLGRMAIFAVLSEVPFQLCFYRAGETGLSLGCHNVMFTLLLASAGICVSDALRGRGMHETPAMLLSGVIAVSLGWVLQTDYNAWGVALIMMLYWLPEKKQRLILLGCWMTVFMLLWHGWNGQTLVWLRPDGAVLILEWLGGMLSVPLLATYQGQRGRSSKWLFYAFYPVHLAVLYAIRCLI